MILPLLAYTLFRINYVELFLEKNAKCFTRNCHFQLNKHSAPSLDPFSCTVQCLGWMILVSRLSPIPCSQRSNLPSPHSTPEEEENRLTSTLRDLLGGLAGWEWLLSPLQIPFPRVSWTWAPGLEKHRLLSLCLIPSGKAQKIAKEQRRLPLSNSRFFELTWARWCRQLGFRRVFI